MKYYIRFFKKMKNYFLKEMDKVLNPRYQWDVEDIRFLQNCSINEWKTMLINGIAEIGRFRRPFILDVINPQYHHIITTLLTASCHFTFYVFNSYHTNEIHKFIDYVCEHTYCWKSVIKKASIKDIEIMKFILTKKKISMFLEHIADCALADLYFSIHGITPLSADVIVIFSKNINALMEVCLKYSRKPEIYRNFNSVYYLIPKLITDIGIDPLLLAIYDCRKFKDIEPIWQTWLTAQFMAGKEFLSRDARLEILYFYFNPRSDGCIKPMEFGFSFPINAVLTSNNAIPFWRK
jgi:hypothetical protein